MYILECTEAAELCKNLEPFLKIIKLVLSILQWTVPILLVALGTFDMFNAVTKSDDEKAVQDARNRLIKRIIYGVIVFLVPLLINLVMELVDQAIQEEGTATSWVSCWNGTIKGMDQCDDIYEPETEDEELCICDITDESTYTNRSYQMTKAVCAENGGTCRSEYTAPTTACYVWKQYECMDDTEYGSDVHGCAADIDLNKGILSGWYDGISSISELWGTVIQDINSSPINSNHGAPEKAEEYCKTMFGKEPKEVYFSSRSDPSKAAFDADDRDIYFTCVYDYQLVEKYTTQKPTKTFDGKYKMYSCRTHPCDSTARTFCDVGEEPEGTTGVQ